jgi:tight adherence protein B
MVTWVLVVTGLCVAAIGYMARGALGFQASAQVTARQNMRNIVAVQRGGALLENEQTVPDKSDSSLQLDPDQADFQPVKIAENRITFQKKLKYAQLSAIPPYAFALAQIAISITAFLLARSVFGTVLQLISLSSGPLLVGWFVESKMNNRFKRFDSDYPQFLLSFVGMLKIGLNPVQALEAAAGSLDERSLVREEIELMLERLKLGVSEERSIGSFGEDVNHPEIELFVQSLILSRRVGGNLSETVDRLSRQVRKRQHFRQSAQAAVGLQRGSIMFILAILVGLEGYLYIVWPECVITTWTDPGATKVAQVGLAMILIGLYWVRQVTKIRV